MFFSGKYFKGVMVLSGLIVLIVVFGHVAFSGDLFRYDHDISGKIVDFDTRKPIQGVVVSACWFTEFTRFSIEPGRKYYDNFETLTDQNGEFIIPGKGLNIMRRMPPPTISIFKSEYSMLHLQDLGVHFRQDHPLNDQVKWEGDKAIIPFSKKTLAERKRYLRSYPTMPFSGMTYAGVPYLKIQLFLAELKREYTAANMIPIHLENQRTLQYVDGGVFPAKATPENPKSSD